MRKKSLIYLLVGFLALLILLAGINYITIYYGGDDNDDGKENNENSLQIEEQDVALIKSKITSRLEGRGIPFEEEKVIAAIVENHTQSRPQMNGLNEASVVYETEAEGGITRFLALYPYQTTEKVGPIRSARPYFVSWAVPYNSAFAHAGGSEAALQYLYSSDDVLDLDGLYWEEFPDYFKRDKRYYAPHNLFANLKEIRELMEEKEWDESLSKKYFNFGENDEVDSFSVDDIEIKYPYPLYYVDYSYDSENEVYLRSQGDTPQIDHADDSQIFTDNVVVLFTDYYPIDDEGRLAMTIHGSGSMYLFTKGKGYEGTWEKASENQPIKYYGLDGENLKFTPGKTWISVINFEPALSWD